MLKTHILIHTFSLLHAVACYVLLHYSVDDAIVLTCLTIAMVIFLSRLYKAPMDVMMGLLLLSALAGFFLGTKGAIWIQLAFPSLSNMAVRCLTTALVTETLGWALFLIVRRRIHNA